MSERRLHPQTLASDPETSVFVSANAGSGKTKTLVDRVARLLLRGVDPSRILCVTYTKAAAAEMQGRLFERLGGWSVRKDADLAQELAALEARPQEEFDDVALMKVVAADGRGFMPVASVVAEEAVTRYGLKIIGSTRKCTDQFYAITAERRLNHPAVVLITENAQKVLFR